MLDNIYVIKRQSQVKALGSELKLNIIKNLMEEPLTCQQLAERLHTSKQKVHYNLKGLYNEELINQVSGLGNDKEKHYQAKARNYVIDFTLGNEVSNNLNNGNRELITSIMEQKHGLDLDKIARKLINNSIRLQKEENLMIVTGRFNLPFVERIQVAATELGATVNILYRDQNFLTHKMNDFSLSAFRKDYDNFINMLSQADVYLYLNGESRYISTSDEQRRELIQQAQNKSRKIIREKGIRVVMMPGLLKDDLSEDNIKREINFWQALDVDYQLLREDTDKVIKEYMQNKRFLIKKHGAEFTVDVDKVFGEYGSFADSEYQSNTINLPGGEVLIIPGKNSINGTIRGSKAYIDGRMVIKPVVEIKNNNIIAFRAEKHAELIEDAIKRGGIQGNEIAMICMGTNYRINADSKDLQHVNKSKGLLTVYWGNNTMMDGDVKGMIEWQIQIEKPLIKKI